MYALRTAERRRSRSAAALRSLSAAAPSRGDVAVSSHSEMAQRSGGRDAARPRECRHRAGARSERAPNVSQPPTADGIAATKIIRRVSATTGHEATRYSRPGRTQRVGGGVHGAPRPWPRPGSGPSAERRNTLRSHSEPSEKHCRTILTTLHIDRDDSIRV
ncbi:hypothetical protein RR48_04005 [Papilio machaon]|uniref:Uncharacterized protein n=1 Tax=Papilio machaon TaxID=76193 RepID=A0A0N1I9K0_PAPMA|nr:hypothetical protein RR48_04005 [Papilio machaon]